MAYYLFIALGLFGFLITIAIFYRVIKVSNELNKKLKEGEEKLLEEMRKIRESVLYKK